MSKYLCVQFAPLEKIGHDQPGGSAVGVNDEPSGKVKGATLEKPTVRAPDPVSEGVVSQDGPERNKDQVGMVGHLLAPSSGNDQRDHDSEHHMEGGKENARNGVGEFWVTA